VPGICAALQINKPCPVGGSDRSGILHFAGGNMKRLTKTLLAVTAMALLVPVRAGVVDRIPAADTPAPTASTSHFSSAVSPSYSFGEIADLPEGAEYRMLTGDMAGPATDRNLAKLSNVTYATPAPLAGGNATRSLLGDVSALNGAIDVLSAAVVPDDRSAFRSADAGSHAGARFLFSTADIPEPTAWMTLLCGLVVAAFIARRKRGPFAN
jgi:hypothetical protein